jgi:hypothetical protein
VIEQSRSLLPCSGKQFECASLVRVQWTLFTQSTHRIAFRRDPASTHGVLPIAVTADALLSGA